MLPSIFDDVFDSVFDKPNNDIMKTDVKVVGRVQSRIYEKKFEDGTSEQRVAYEVSIGNLEVIDKKEDEEQANVEQSNEQEAM